MRFKRTGIIAFARSKEMKIHWQKLTRNGVFAVFPFLLVSSLPQWRLVISMDIKPVSLFEVDQCCLPEHSCSQPFFVFFKESSLVECFYSKVKEKQQQGLGGAGFFVWVFFDPSVCVTGGRAAQKSSEAECAGSRSQTSLGVGAGICQNVGEVGKRIWVGFCWSFGFWGFFNKGWGKVQGWR